MIQSILLFLHKDIRPVAYFSLPYLSIEGIIEYTYRRNKIINRNRLTAMKIILSAGIEKTKRIKSLMSILLTVVDYSVRYINCNYYKGYCKNTYQVVSSPIDGGSRP